MKKGYPFLFLAGALALTASAQSKFDAQSRLVMETYKAVQQNQTVAPELIRSLPVAQSAVMSRSGERVAVIVKLTGNAVPADLEARGMEVVTDLGDMAIVNGTMDDIAALAECDFVKSISFGSTARPMLDRARTATGADIVQAGGDGLGKPYNGEGVIIGIYDTGIDPNHVNFTDANGNTRVKRMWQYTGTNGTSQEFTDANISRFQASTTETHGTHTLGCATGAYNKRIGTTAGDGVAIVGTNGTVNKSSRNANPYYGMAPGAEIAAGDGQLNAPNYLAAIGKIRDYAKEQGKPAVVNLSIGTNIGPHDGTDETSEALSRLGEDVIICMSAGNEGDYPMSIVKTFSSSEKEFKTFINGNTTEVEAMCFWSDSSTPFTLIPFVYDRSKKQVVFEYVFEGGQERTVGIVGGTYGNSYVPGGNKVTSDILNSAYSGTCFIMTSSKNAGTNNRYSVSVNLGLTVNNSTNASRNLVFGFRVQGQAGQRVEVATNSATAQLSSLNESGFTAGTADLSINSMAAARNVIAVGAWNTRKAWPCLSGSFTSYYDNSGYEEGDYAGYSSFGVLCDGRSLPHVSAPGSGIISSISTPYYNAALRSNPNLPNTMSAIMTVNGRLNAWEAMQGTSMASPVVAGGIALWLQQNKDLSYDDVLTAINNSSVKDANVQAGPAVRWGAGKFNALQGLKYVIDPAGVGDVIADGDASLILTPNGVNAWEVYAPYANGMQVDLYNMAGMRVASAKGEGNTLQFSAEGMAKGVYLLNVNGTETRRVMVD